MYEGAVFSVLEPRGARPDADLRTTSSSAGLEHADGRPHAVQRQYTTGNDLKHPRVDEFNVSLEQQIGRQFKFTATGHLPRVEELRQLVLIDGQWTPFAYTPPAWTDSGPSPMSTAPVTLYKWANPTTSPEFTIQNTDTVSYNLTDGGDRVGADAYRKYKGLMLVLPAGAPRTAGRRRCRTCCRRRRARSATAPTRDLAAASSRRRTRAS